MGTGSILVSGFALFAMFFGAGNLIFPPYLGMTGGSQWIAGFLSFFLVEILSCVGIHAMLHGGGSIRAMQKSVGAAPGAVLNAAAILCTGVFIAPPRTAATTYEMAIQPLTDKLDLLPFSILFFAVVLLLTIRPTRVVDIVGRCLTPVLILGILVLILAGILHPIGPIEPPVSPNIIHGHHLGGRLCRHHSGHPGPVRSEHLAPAAPPCGRDSLCRRVPAGAGIQWSDLSGRHHCKPL